MELDRRVTLRCLVEDLTADWGNIEDYRSVKNLRSTIRQCLANEIPESRVAHQLRNIHRVNSLDHPLIRHFDGAFSPDYDAGSKESISGLTDPHWWKQKTNRWRGAATDHSTVGPSMVWLCAAGLRRAGDADDFYKAFMRDVGRVGPERWLPGEEDYLVCKVDEKILAMDAWKLQVHCSVLALLVEARQRAGEHTIQFTAPSRVSTDIVVGELNLSVESVDVDGDELCEVFLTVKILDHNQVNSVDVAAQIARAALQSDAECWHSTTFTEDAFAFSALIDPTALDSADELSRTGSLPEGSVPAGLRLGLRAHYARKQGLVHAQVEGSSVLSLCGYWFVPTADHMNLETCGECAKRHDKLGMH